MVVYELAETEDSGFTDCKTSCNISFTLAPRERTSGELLVVINLRITLSEINTRLSTVHFF